MATNTPGVHPSIRMLPLPVEAQELFSRAVQIVKSRPSDFKKVKKWLNKRYSEGDVRKRCKREYRDDFARRLQLLRLDDSPTYNRRLAIQGGCALEDLKRRRIEEAHGRGQRLEGTEVVTKPHPVDTVIDETNVLLVWRWEDERYRQDFQEIKAEHKAAELYACDHSKSRVWRLRLAVSEIIKAEYPDPPKHIEHSREIVAIASLLVWPEPLPMLGKLGQWKWESEPDATWDANPTDPMDDFWRKVSRPPTQDGPHKIPLHGMVARVVGREEAMFFRRPLQDRELDSSLPLDDLLKLLRIAVDVLQAMVNAETVQASAGDGSGGPGLGGDPSKPADGTKDVPDGTYSPTEIARAMNAYKKRNAIRMALKRLFDENQLPGDAWIENNNPVHGQAKILYRLSLVRPFLARFEPSGRG